MEDQFACVHLTEVRDALLQQSHPDRVESHDTAPRIAFPLRMRSARIVEAKRPHDQLGADAYSDVEDPDEQLAESVSWSYSQAS